MPPPLADESVEQAYLQAVRALQVWTLRLGCVIGLITMPLGGLVDMVVYSDSAGRFFASRIVCDVVLGAILLVLYSKFGTQHVRLLTLLAAAAPVVSMCWMIADVDGASSMYYAGLNLVIIVLCLLFPYGAGEAAGYCLLVVFLYCGASVWHALTPDAKTFPWGEFWNNLYFLILTSVIGVYACHFNKERRISEFRLRHRVDLQNQKLTQLDEIKSRFFANISHELRTPLTLILAPAEELFQERQRLPAEFGLAVGVMRQNGYRLLGLINDLLDVARLEDGRLTLRRTPLRLDEFVAGLVEASRSLATQKGLRLEVHVPPEPLVVEGDEAKLERVVLNLLSNAIKFTRPGGRVQVTCRRVGDLAQVEVSDTGIGIAPGDLPNVFDRFYQGQGSRPCQATGTGLGLAVAKEMAEAHGGRLLVTSIMGQGSTFTLDLPMARTPAGETAAPATPDAGEDSDVLQTMFQAARLATVAPAVEWAGAEQAGAGSDRPRLLIVDDEADMRQFLTASLCREHSVWSAADGAAALELARTHKPNLVLLDVMLPDTDGLEVCRVLRQEEDLPDLKILMLTARLDETLRIEALQSGADDFLTKPFSMLEVKTRIRNLLLAAVLQQDLRQRNQELQATLDRLKRTEAQLIQSEKMNALGHLAAGLLHEINNPLNYMTMAVAMVKRTLPPEDPKLAKRIQDIDAGIKRIAEILAGLREFAYPERADLHQAFSIQDAVKTALRFTAHDLQDVRVEAPPPDQDACVLGSRTHVTQVFVNILSNAAHAVKPIRSQRQALVRLTLESRDGRLYVTVWDNGVGIDNQVISHIFNPFFTTREVGKGTGLGLSISHTLVEKHGGTIRVRSQPGEWTEFTFDLPLAA